jgi:hypothetical protein
MPETVQRSFLNWFGSVCALALLVWLVTNPADADEATSQNFRLIGQTSLMAAGEAQSTGFRLQSCIDTSPSGISSSPSFKLGSGCTPLVLSATEDKPPEPPNPPNPATPSQAVPVFDGWKLALLMLVLALFAFPSRGGRRIV